MAPRLTGNLVTLASMALWSTTFPTAEILLETWHPLLLTPVRLGTASLALLLLLVATGRAGALAGVPWRDVFLVGGFGLGLATLSLITGQAYADAVTVAIIGTGIPLVAALMGYLAGDEVLRPALLCGVGLVIAGGVIATLAAAEGGPGFEGGELLVLASTTLFVWYSRNAVRRLARLDDIVKAALTLGAGALFLVPVALAAQGLGLAGLSWDLSPRSLLLILWMGGVAVALSMTLWLAGCRLLGSVTLAGIHQNSVPFFVMLAALATGGELFLGQLWGALLVIAGALLAQLPTPLGGTGKPSAGTGRGRG